MASTSPWLFKGWWWRWWRWWWWWWEVWWCKAERGMRATTAVEITTVNHKQDLNHDDARGSGQIKLNSLFVAWKYISLHHFRKDTFYHNLWVTIWVTIWENAPMQLQDPEGAWGDQREAECQDERDRGGQSSAMMFLLCTLCCLSWLVVAVIL